VTLKVSTRDLVKDPQHERDIMKKLNEGNSDHDGYAHVIPLLDAFVHEGPNGPHMCLVYKAVGESLSRFQTRFKDQRLPPHLVRRVSRQLLQALDYSHSCGIIHTRRSFHSSDLTLGFFSLILQTCRHLPNK